MALTLINRRPVQHVLEGYAKPGDTYITFPGAKNINPAPNSYQVRPGAGMWLVTLTASDPEAQVWVAMQNRNSLVGQGSVTICGRIENSDLWVLARPVSRLEQETSYVLTLTKTSPPPA